MIFIYSLLLISVNFIKSAYIIGNRPFLTAYYESLSNPVICMYISHKNPSGPLYLFATFIFKSYSILNHTDEVRKHTQYIFKRINSKCESNVNFTIMRNDFKFIEIIILSLSKYNETLADFEYKFYRRFNFGIYGLLDIYRNFGMLIKVTNGSQHYLDIPISFTEDNESYLHSIKTKNNELCVITKNNNAVVLKPYYESDKPFGYISTLFCIIYRNGVRHGEIKYPTYSCNKNTTYPESPTIFINDGESFIIRFYVIYRKYFEMISESSIKEFTLTTPKFVGIQDLSQIPRKYNQLFLVRYYMDDKDCEDGSWAISYFSDDGTRYFVEVKKMIKIIPFVEVLRIISRSLEDPCRDLKNKKLKIVL